MRGSKYENPPGEVGEMRKAVNEGVNGDDENTKSESSLSFFRFFFLSPRRGSLKQVSMMMMMMKPRG